MHKLGKLRKGCELNQTYFLFSVLLYTPLFGSLTQTGSDGFNLNMICIKLFPTTADSMELRKQHRYIKWVKHLLLLFGGKKQIISSLALSLHWIGLELDNSGDKHEQDVNTPKKLMC